MTRLARLFLFVWLDLSAHALPSQRTREAAADANVAVQAQPALRKGTAFWKEWSVNNATAPVR